jgi:glucose-6-phosphate isomerase
MRMIANREGYRTLPVPPAIGGRFSALTPVGLFPAACAGIKVKGLVAGAKREMDGFFSDDLQATDVAPLMFAGLHHAAYVAGWGRIAVLMPYAAGLKDFGAWFAQLWAESLGKEMSRGGERVNHGQTPIAALGATDQHSQIQLFSEGPRNKVITFIETEKFRRDLKVPQPYPDTEGVSYLGGHSFSEIIHVERRATAEALRDRSRPNGTIFIPEISPETVGGLMAFFMLATAAAGELLDVNAYDQPGVEGGKKIMYRLLGRPGF